MSLHIASADLVDPKAHAFYATVLKTIQASEIPFLVGGAYAFECYTGIVRPTKDLDIFIRKSDCDRLFEVFTAMDYRTEFSFPHWLGKVFSEEDFVDAIFNSANGIDEVDDSWFKHALEAEVFGISVKICSAEDIMRSKAFIMERERFDGADVAHLLHCYSGQLNWSRLMERFGSHWRVLLSHLILFGFIYPAKGSCIPNWVMQELLQRLHSEMSSTPSSERVCQGTLLSRAQYLLDIQEWGYEDARLSPRGNMTQEEIAQWTEAIQENG